MAHIIEPDHRAHAARGPGLSYQLGAKLLGQPLAMRMAAANRLKAAIEAREFDSSVQVALPGLSKFAGTVDQRSRFRVTDDGVAIVPVGGLLIDRGGWLGDLGGFATSYEGLEEQIRRIEKDSAIKSVVLDIDSPGGMVAGIFDVCGLLTRLKKSRKVYALAANMADSAAYAIACVAHEVHVTRTGEVGSIGVIQYHQSYARALDASGIDTTIIFEGERKPDGNPFQQLSHGARSDMAADSADIYQQFVRHVAKARGLEEDRVRGTQARTYRGQKAVEAGAEAIEVDVIGLATDYCVKFTALDAAAETYKGSPFKVRVVIDACRGLGPVEPVIAELKAAGIEVVNSDAVLPAAAGK